MAVAEQPPKIDAIYAVVRQFDEEIHHEPTLIAMIDVVLMAMVDYSKKIKDFTPATAKKHHQQIENVIAELRENLENYRQKGRTKIADKIENAITIFNSIEASLDAFSSAKSASAIRSYNSSKISGSKKQGLVWQPGLIL